jgi:hypothetical protein
MRTSSKPDHLLESINAAVKAANEAEAAAMTARDELVSRSKQVGLLLLEAKKLHPMVKDFDAFLKQVDGLQMSRAYEMMKLAGGRTTDEELRKEARERQQRKRERDRLSKAKQPKAAEPLRDVTESPGVGSNDIDPVASAEARKADYAGGTPGQKAKQASAKNLAEFVVAARLYLPKITIEADRAKALTIRAAIRAARHEGVPVVEVKIGDEATVRIPLVPGDEPIAEPDEVVL